MAEVTVVSGGGPYADEWHDFAATSARVAALITDLGHRVVVVDDVEAALAEPEGDLLVANVGNPSPARPAGSVIAAADGVERFLAGGGALLALHISIGSLPDAGAWSRALGGRWVWGSSWHPDLAAGTVRLRHDVPPDVRPLVEGLADITVTDERYCDLAVADDVTVLGEHEEGGRDQPMIWARATATGRVVYDGLGHDVRSFDSASHVAFLANAVRWLLREG